MKALIVLVVLAALVPPSLQKVLTKQYTNEVKAIQQRCKTENSVSDEDFKKMVNNEKLATSRNEKCFAACYAKGMNYTDSSGNFNLDGLKASNKKKYDGDDIAKVDQICTECVNKNTDTDPCDRAANFFVCLYGQLQAQKIPVPKYHPSS